MNWNTVIYADCMNPENGLPTLEDKSIDLCLTDPPYNVKAKPNSQRRLNYQTKDAKTQDVGYNDYIENYEDFCITWFKEIDRICNMIIFTPGTNNIFFWNEIKKIGISNLFYHYKPNGQGVTGTARFNRIEPILAYGLPNKFPFNENVFRISLSNGFMRDRNYIHPHPKEFKLYYRILKELRPKSVIDHFLGSGTTAEACTKLGIPWIGYELKKEYSQDINMRLKHCRPIKKLKQHSLV